MGALACLPATFWWQRQGQGLQPGPFALVLAPHRTHLSASAGALAPAARPLHCICMHTYTHTYTHKGLKHGLVLQHACIHTHTHTGLKHACVHCVHVSPPS